MASKMTAVANVSIDIALFPN